MAYTLLHLPIPSLFGQYELSAEMIIIQTRVHELEHLDRVLLARKFNSKWLVMLNVAFQLLVDTCFQFCMYIELFLCLRSWVDY